MKTTAFVLVSVLFLLGCATTDAPKGNQAGDKCEAPVMSVGDYWRFRNEDGGEWTQMVDAIETFGDTQIYVLDDGYSPFKKGYNTKNLQHIVSINRDDGQKLVPMTDWAFFFEFPLYVGKKWEKMVSGVDAENNPRRYLYTFKVVAFEDVAVRAGTFKAYKIEFTQYDYVWSSDLKVYFWFSPEVKREIKFQYGPQYGLWKVSGQGYELLRFELKQKPSQKAASPGQAARPGQATRGGK